METILIIAAAFAILVAYGIIKSGSKKPNK